MSRRAREEIPFGSDSFLDVLANMVGILIILIVSAAARMGRAPDPVAAAPARISHENSVPIAAATPPPAPLAPQPIPELEPDAAPTEVTAELKGLTEKV